MLPWGRSLWSCGVSAHGGSLPPGGIFYSYGNSGYPIPLWYWHLVAAVSMHPTGMHSWFRWMFSVIRMHSSKMHTIHCRRGNVCLGRCICPGGCVYLGGVSTQRVVYLDTVNTITDRCKITRLVEYLVYWWIFGPAVLFTEDWLKYSIIIIVLCVYIYECFQKIV